MVMSRIPRVRKLITLCILFRVSRKQNYRDIPGGWMDAVHQCKAGERMDWATLIASNLVTQLDVIRMTGRGRLSYSTLLLCWFFNHFRAVALAGGPHPIVEWAPMVHRWQAKGDRGLGPCSALNGGYIVGPPHYDRLCGRSV